MKVEAFVFFALALAVVIPSVLSIRCYSCSGKDSSCEKFLNCTGLSSLDTCMYSKVGDQYVRSCSDKSTCESSADGCKKAGTCTIGCCQKDLCNKDAPSTPKPPSTSLASLQTPVAVITLVSSALASVLYLL